MSAKNPLLICCSLAALITALAVPVTYAAAASADPAKFSLRRAFHKDSRRPILAGKTPALRFRPVQNIDWQEMARKHFRLFALEQLSDRARKRLQQYRVHNVAEIPFRFPLPEAWKAGNFYFISDQGIRPLLLHEAEGIVRYRFRPGTDELLKSEFSGFIIASPVSGELTDGGFVWHSSDATKFSPTRPLQPEESRFNLLRRRGGKTATEYAFNALGRQYYFFHLQPDPDCRSNCCTFRYLLVRKNREGSENPAAPIGVNSYLCDV